MHTANKKPPRERITDVVHDALYDLERENKEAWGRYDDLKKKYDALKVQNEELTNQLRGF